MFAWLLSEDCKLCRWLTSPYYFAGGYLSRFFVNIATLLWAAIVLYREEALNQKWSVYRGMVNIMPEDYWAWIALAATAFGMYRLCRKVRPSWWGAIGYIMQMLFWVFLASSLYTVDTPLLASPAATAAITVIALLSIHAAASNSKVRRESL